jgi:hypothetical protein
MKANFLFVSVIALAALTSCSNDETMDAIEKGNAITFRATTEKPMETRAVDKTEANITDFKVSSLYEGGTGFFDFTNVNVVRKSGGAVGSNTSWEYAPERFWPLDGNLTFFAYSPAGSQNVTDFSISATGQTIDYKVSSNLSLQEDFLVAESAKIASPASNAVNLPFKHALSQVIFSARSIVNGVSFEISEVGLENLNSSGTLDLTSAPLAWTSTTTLDEDYKAAIEGTVTVGYSSSKHFTLTGHDNGLLTLPQLTPVNKRVDRSRQKLKNKPIFFTINTTYP